MKTESVAETPNLTSLGDWIEAIDKSWITTAMVTLTPDGAAAMRQKGIFGWQRPINIKTAKNYANDINSGMFVGFCSNLTIVRQLDAIGNPVEQWLVNGNHTAEGVYLARVANPDASLVVQVTTVDVPHDSTISADNVARAFYVGFDRGAKRDQTAIDRALDMEKPLFELKQELRRSFPSAMAFIVRAFAPKGNEVVESWLRLDSTVATLRRIYLSQVYAYDQIYRGMTPEAMVIARQPLFMGLSLELLRSEQFHAKAREFIDLATSGQDDEGELSAEHPCRALFTELDAIYVSKPKPKGAHGAVVGRFSQAWNAYLNGATIGIDGKGRPKWSKSIAPNLTGTPFTIGGDNRMVIDGQPLVILAKHGVISKPGNVDLAVPNPVREAPQLAVVNAA